MRSAPRAPVTGFKSTGPADGALLATVLSMIRDAGVVPAPASEDSPLLRARAVEALACLAIHTSVKAAVVADPSVMRGLLRIAEAVAARLAVRARAACVAVAACCGA
jgi:hypothetical protein